MYQIKRSANGNVVLVFIVSEPLISTQVYHQKLEVISRAELSVERIRSIK